MYVLSELLGLGMVQPTVIRDGPRCAGSFQWFVDADHSEHDFTVYEQHEHLDHRLSELAVLDVVGNKTDRKSGHCLLQPGADGDPAGDRVWAIDNGLCFGSSYKLRSVIWECGGEPVDDALLDRIAPMVERIPVDIAALLDDDEIEAMQRRAAALLTERRLTEDDSGHLYPWQFI